MDKTEVDNWSGIERDALAVGMIEKGASRRLKIFPHSPCTDRLAGPPQQAIEPSHAELDTLMHLNS